MQAQCQSKPLKKQPKPYLFSSSAIRKPAISQAMPECGLLKDMQNARAVCSLFLSRKPTEGCDAVLCARQVGAQALANAIRAGGCRSTCIAMIALSLGPSDSYRAYTLNHLLLVKIVACIR